LNEDRELELEFRRFRDGENIFHKPIPFTIQFADKKVNSDGLQFADMTARPIGMSILRQDQPNRAFEILKPKLHRDGTGKYQGVGLKVFP
jgi:hypothetical protein